jgi:hypothetical protein
MNDKSLIKYEHGDDSGLLHYVVYNGDVVVLSEKKTQKVSHIQKHDSLKVTFDIKSNDLQTVPVSVVMDPVYVEKVYNYMINTNNAYFEDGFEHLCVIKFEKR